MPGNAGGTGRPPKTLATFLQGLRQSDAVHNAIQRAATDESSRGFGVALKLAQDYDPERPSDKRELSGEVTIRVARDD